MPSYKLRIGAAILFLGLASSTFADAVTYEFEGSLNGPIGTLPIGSVFQGSITYDTTNPELNGIGDPDFGLYALDEFEVSFGTDFIRTTCCTIKIDNRSTFDQIAVQSQPALGATVGGVLGGIDFSAGQFDLALADLSATALSSDALPGVGLTLADFPTSPQLAFSSNTGVFVLGTITAFSAEPPVQTVPVTITGMGDADGTYEVTTIEGTYTDLVLALLETQVWWEDQALAERFASLVGDSLGLPGEILDFDGSVSSIYGPRFAWTDDFPGASFPVVAVWNDTFQSTFSLIDNLPVDEIRVFAVASRVTVPPELLLEQLETTVTGIGSGNSFANKIMLAQAYLAVPDEESACLVLGGFLNQVQAQRGKKLTDEQADQFTADAEAIIAAIGCD